MKYIVAITLPLFTILLLAGCKQELISNPAQYTKVYMPQAISYPAVQNLVMTDSLQSVYFGAAYGGVNDQSQVVNVRFKTDFTLVDSFNKKNGTSYLPLPTAAFQADQTAGVMEVGVFNTRILSAKIKTVGGVEPLKEYLLPVTIADVSPAIPVNENLRTTYFLIKGTYSEFVRTGWKVTVSSQEAPNIGVNAFDGNVTTQWHTQWKTAVPPHPHVATVDMNEVKMIHGFFFWPSASVTTGNPQTIHIDVSMDGSNWTDGGNYTFTNVYQKFTMYLNSPVQAQFFKVTVTSSFGNTQFTHIAEIGAF